MATTKFAISVLIIVHVTHYLYQRLYVADAGSGIRHSLMSPKFAIT